MLKTAANTANEVVAVAALAYATYSLTKLAINTTSHGATLVQNKIAARKNK